MVEKTLQREEKDDARARKRKAAETYAKPRPSKGPVRIPSDRPTKSSLPRKTIRLHDDRRLSIKRQSSRAHAVEIAGAVERRLVEQAAKKVSSRLALRLKLIS